MYSVTCGYHLLDYLRTFSCCLKHVVSWKSTVTNVNTWRLLDWMLLKQVESCSLRGDTAGYYSLHLSSPYRSLLWLTNDFFLLVQGILIYVCSVLWIVSRWIQMAFTPHTLTLSATEFLDKFLFSQKLEKALLEQTQVTIFGNKYVYLDTVLGLLVRLLEK